MDRPAELEDDIEEEGEEEGPDEMEAGNDPNDTAENIPVSKPGWIITCMRKSFVSVTFRMECPDF